ALARRRGADAGDQHQLAGLARPPRNGVQVDLGLVAAVGLDLVLAEAELRRDVDDLSELRFLRDLDVRQHRSLIPCRCNDGASPRPGAGYCGAGGAGTRSAGDRPVARRGLPSGGNRPFPPWLCPTGRCFFPACATRPLPSRARSPTRAPAAGWPPSSGRWASSRGTRPSRPTRAAPLASPARRTCAGYA